MFYNILQNVFVVIRLLVCFPLLFHCALNRLGLFIWR